MSAQWICRALMCVGIGILLGLWIAQYPEAMTAALRPVLP